jgi:hypothetical protein
MSCCDKDYRGPKHNTMNARRSVEMKLQAFKTLLLDDGEKYNNYGDSTDSSLNCSTKQNFMLQQSIKYM